MNTIAEQLQSIRMQSADLVRGDGSRILRDKQGHFAGSLPGPKEAATPTKPRSPSTPKSPTQNTGAKKATTKASAKGAKPTPSRGTKAPSGKKSTGIGKKSGGAKGKSRTMARQFSHVREGIRLGVEGFRHLQQQTEGASHHRMSQGDIQNRLSDIRLAVADIIRDFEYEDHLGNVHHVTQGAKGQWTNNQIIMHAPKGGAGAQPPRVRTLQEAYAAKVQQPAKPGGKTGTKGSKSSDTKSFKISDQIVEHTPIRTIPGYVPDSAHPLDYQMLSQMYTHEDAKDLLMHNYTRETLKDEASRVQERARAQGIESAPKSLTKIADLANYIHDMTIDPTGNAAKYSTGTKGDGTKTSVPKDTQKTLKPINTVHESAFNPYAVPNPSANHRSLGTAQLHYAISRFSLSMLRSIADENSIPTQGVRNNHDALAQRIADFQIAKDGIIPATPGKPTAEERSIYDAAVKAMQSARSSGASTEGGASLDSARITSTAANLANMDIEALRQMAEGMGLPTTGGKDALAKRIATMQVTGKAPSVKGNKTLNALSEELQPIRTGIRHTFDPSAPPDTQFLHQMYGTKQLTEALARFAPARLKETAKAEGVKLGSAKTKEEIIQKLVDHAVTRDGVDAVNIAGPVPESNQRMAIPDRLATIRSQIANL